MIYTNIFIKHDQEAKGLLLDIGFWTEEEGGKIFKKFQCYHKKTDGKTIIGLHQMKIRTSANGKASPIWAIWHKMRRK